jgi:hypothetical protein
MDITEDALQHQRQALVESVQTLPGEVLQELADFVEYLRHKAGALEVERPNEGTPYEILQESGFIGCAEGPSDLAANHKAYLERYLTKKYDQHWFRLLACIS